MHQPRTFRSVIPLVVICTAFFLVGIFRLNDISIYTPDSIHYLIWGNSIAQGKGFVDETQPDPERFVINAPLYALLTAPVHLFFPMSLIAVKIYTLLWGVLLLILVYLWIRRTYGSTAALIATAIMAVNPAIVLFSTEVLSEIPFIAFIILSMLLVEKNIDSDGRKRAYIASLILCAAFIPLLREVGVALVGALAIYFGTRRQIGKAVVLVFPAVVLFGLWYLRNSQFVGTGGGASGTNLMIASHHIVTPETSSIIVEYMLRVWLALKSYASYLGGMIFYPIWSPDFASTLVHPSRVYRITGFFLLRGEYLINAFVLITAGAGVVWDVRRSATALLRVAFVGLFLLVVCIYPVHDIRFVDPLLPFILYYLIGGLTWFRERMLLIRKIPARVWAFSAIALLVVPDAIGLQELVSANLEYRQSPEDLRTYVNVPPIYRYQWHAIEEWIGPHVSDSAVIASPFKDLTLVAGHRKVLEIDPSTMLPLFESLLRDYHAEYVYAAMRWSDLRDFEFAMRESRRFWFEPVKEAPNLMRVHSRLRDPEHAIIPHQDFDTSRTSELLRKGRAEIVRGEYPAAVRTLQRAVERISDQPEILYQAMIASMMAEDSTGAAGYFHQLLGLTQTMSWTSMARMHFDALRLVLLSRHVTQSEQRAVVLQRAASFYWKMGYPRRAAELLVPLLEDEPGYYIGLLWGLQYHLENGDTARAREFLARVQRVDSANVLSRSYGKLFALGDSLKSATSDSARSNFHLAAGVLYADMGLKEEAIDECEQALRFDKKNIDAVMTMGKVFETKGRPRAALRSYREALHLQPGYPEAFARTDSLSRILLSN